MLGGPGAGMPPHAGAVLVGGVSEGFWCQLGMLGVS